MANSRNPIEDIKRRRAEMRDQQQQEQTSRNPERDIAARTEALRQELGNPVQEDRQAETVNDIVKYEPESGSERVQSRRSQSPWQRKPCENTKTARQISRTG